MSQDKQQNSDSTDDDTATEEAIIRLTKEEARNLFGHMLFEAPREWADSLIMDYYAATAALTGHSVHVDPVLARDLVNRAYKRGAQDGFRRGEECGEKNADFVHAHAQEGNVKTIEGLTKKLAEYERRIQDLQDALKSATNNT